MSKTLNKKIVFNSCLIIIFGLISLLSFTILLRSHYVFNALDMQFHLKRLYEVKESILHGHILPLFSFDTFHGSSALIYYPYMNLIPVALLSIFIKSLPLIVYIFFGINTFFALVVSYYSSLPFSNSKITSIVFSFIYSLSTPLFTWSFFNMDMGVMTAIAVLPMAFFGLINLLKNTKYVELCVGLTLIAYSHVLSLIIVIILLIIMLVINCKFITKLIRKDLCKIIGLFLLLTSIIWMPAIKLSLMNMGNLEPPHPNVLFGTNFSFLIKSVVFNKLSFTLNIFALMTLILPILFYKYFYKHFTRYMKQAYWISVLTVFLCSNLFPWFITNHSVFKVFRIFQFTRRFYIIPELLLSYIFAYCITQLIRNKNVKWILLSLTIMITCGFQLMCQRSLIKRNISAPTPTNAIINKQTYTTNTKIHHKILPFKYFHVDSRGLFFKMKNNSQIYKYMNITTDNVDYYPIKSLYDINSINNNYGRLLNNKIIPIKYYGYNHFMFNMRHNSRIILPIVNYNGEHVHLYDNNKPITHCINNDNLIELKSTNRGLNRLSINYSPDVFIDIIRVCLFALGLFWLMYKFAKWLKSNKFNMLRN